MQPPSSALGQILAGAAVLGAGAIAGGFANRAATSSLSGTPATTASFLGGSVGAMAVAFGGAILGATSSKWARVGRTTAILGLGAFTAASLAGIGRADRLLTSAASGGNSAAPQAQPSTAIAYPVAVAPSTQTAAAT